MNTFCVCVWNPMFALSVFSTGQIFSLASSVWTTPIVWSRSKVRGALSCKSLLHADQQADPEYPPPPTQKEVESHRLAKVLYHFRIPSSLTRRVRSLLSGYIEWKGIPIWSYRPGPNVWSEANHCSEKPVWGCKDVRGGGTLSVIR